MVWFKRLRPRDISRMQVKCPRPSKLCGPSLTNKLSRRERNGQMLLARSPAIKSSLNKHTAHGPPDTHASGEVSPPSKIPAPLARSTRPHRAKLGIGGSGGRPPGI
jgi:hypothetical protein